MEHYFIILFFMLTAGIVIFISYYFSNKTQSYASLKKQAKKKYQV